MAHSLIDRNPGSVGLNALVLLHNADWSGNVEIRWRVHPKQAAAESVEINGDKLLNGIIDVDVPMNVAARAVALACQEYAIMRVRESIERIEFKPGKELTVFLCPNSQAWLNRPTLKWPCCSACA